MRVDDGDDDDAKRRNAATWMRRARDQRPAQPSGESGEREQLRVHADLGAVPDREGSQSGEGRGRDRAHVRERMAAPGADAGDGDERPEDRQRAHRHRRGPEQLDPAVQQDMEQRRMDAVDLAGDHVHERTVDLDQADGLVEPQAAVGDREAHEQRAGQDHGGQEPRRPGGRRRDAAEGKGGRDAHRATSAANPIGGSTWEMRCGSSALTGTSAPSSPTAASARPKRMPSATAASG